MAQLVERLLLTSEVCGLNPFLVKTFTEHLFPVNCIEKTKIKEEEAWNGQFLKKTSQEASCKHFVLNLLRHCDALVVVVVSEDFIGSTKYMKLHFKSSR